MGKYSMEQMPVRRPRKSIDWESYVREGQNPNGFTAQTVNGTAHAGNCPGWNRVYNQPPMPEVPATETWANANRSGE